jgi:hypothetical protein
LSESTPDLTAEPVYDQLPKPTPETIAAPPPACWSFATRLAFRFAFCYFMIYALCSGFLTIWETIPWAGGYIENWLAWPFRHAAQWLSLHVFHLHGIGTTLGDSDSGDTALNWIAIGVRLAVAFVAMLLWTALDHRRKSYPTLFGWFRFILRLTLGVAMLSYGLDKVFLSQMPPPSLAVLNEPLGNTSPMMLLWTMMGLNPGYQVICGAAEVIAGLLILCRRTALLGALVTAFVVSNVVLYDYFFDVPVKIYAAHLLLMALVVISPTCAHCFPTSGYINQRHQQMVGHRPHLVAALASPSWSSKPPSSSWRWVMGPIARPGVSCR